jgi:putative heme-binding domain-containing protein
MWRLTLGLVCATLAAQQQEAVTNPRTSPADIEQGGNTFRGHCAPCHGLKGEGGRGPNLSNGIFYHGSSDAALLENISEGIPGTEMPALFYSPDRVWQVIAYIRSLRPTAHDDVARLIKDGEALFQLQGCPQCHRVNANGSRIGPDLSEIGRIRSAEYLRASIIDPDADVGQRYWIVNLTDAGGKSYKGFLMNEDTYTVQFIDSSGRLYSMEKSGLKSFDIDKTSKMPSYKEKLSNDQVDQLVAYLSSLRTMGVPQ